MTRLARFLLFALLLAALPLRGYAGVLSSLCESHHGGGAVHETHVHEHGESHDQDAGDSRDGPSHTASVCGMCASCCAGAVLAPETYRGISLQPPAAHRIPFFGRQVSGFVPEHLDRPPLVS